MEHFMATKPTSSRYHIRKDALELRTIKCLELNILRILLNSDSHVMKVLQILKCCRHLYVISLN